MSRRNRKKFTFKRQETIGAEGAEQDQQFLSSCFVHTGDLDILKDTNNPKSIVLGRTGAGKTALLINLKDRQDHVSWLEPDQLALQYLANSTILRYLEDLGVKLDIFYRLLWRHIFAVELIKLKYQVRNLNEQSSFIERMRNLFFGDRR